MRLLFALTVLVGLCSPPALADERFLPYLEWIAENSDYEYNGEPLPPVRYTSKGMLQVLAYGEERVAQAEYHGQTLDEVQAVYEDGTIVLPDGFDFDDINTQHIILHELVHYMQDINGHVKECVPDNEPEAYVLHGKWQDDHDSPAARPNMFFVFLLSMACAEDPWHGYDHAR